MQGSNSGLFLVSIQLVSPASGESWLTLTTSDCFVSIQFVSPASGEVFLAWDRHYGKSEFPFNLFPQRVGRNLIYEDGAKVPKCRFPFNLFPQRVGRVRCTNLTQRGIQPSNRRTAKI
jgi:hypothetical protein